MPDPSAGPAHYFMSNTTRRKSRNTPPQTPPPRAERGKPPQPVIVTDLRAIESIHREAVGVDILISGRLFRFEGRRLIPSESNQIKALMQLALPPLLPPEKEGGEPRYNFGDPDYEARHESARRNARALALWLGYACFKAEAVRLLKETPNSELNKLPETVEEIGAFIESRAMDDDALQMLFAGLTHRSVELQAFVNFTSGNGSLRS